MLPGKTNLQFSKHDNYIKRYQSANNYDDYLQLQHEVQEEENIYREMFAIDRTNKTLHNDHLMMIPVYDNFDSFSLRNTTPEEENIPRIFEQKSREEGLTSVVSSHEEFVKNFNVFTEGMLKDINWDNMFVAGGSVLAALIPQPKEYETTQRNYYHDVAYKNSDIDVFIYGLNEEQANKKMEEIYKHIERVIHVGVVAFRSQHAVTIVSQYPYRHVQIVLRLYMSPAEVLMGFDVDSCAMGYDGKNVYVMPRCHQALVTRYNTIDMTRRSPSYEMRLAKYSSRGFGVIVPFLERNRIDPQIFERPFEQVQGLARLLLLERLGSPESRTQYKNQQRLRQLRPEGERRGAYWEKINTTFARDDYVCERESDGSSVASDYSTVFLAWGPQWTAEKVRHLMYTKDLILNSEWYDEDKKYHTHPCFFGTVKEIMQDCCGMCPPEPERQEIDPKTGMDNPFVKGPLTWVTVNPGAQTIIGSFHPITEGDWTQGAYIEAITEDLCLVVSADDHKEVTKLILEGAKVDSRDALGRTPLIVATLNNSIKSAKILLENKAWISHKIAGGRTALHIAAQYGHTEIAKMILERGVELGGAIENNENEEEDNEDEDDFVVVGKRKRNDSDIDEDSFGKPEEEQKDKLEIDCKDNDMNMTPFLYAAFFGSNEILKLLITHGANVEQTLLLNQRQTPAAYLPSVCDHIDTLLLLLENGAPINQKDSNFNTVLHLAAENGKENFVRAILDFQDQKVNINSLNNKFESALHLAVKNRHASVAQLLIDYGALIDYTKSDFEEHRSFPSGTFKNSFTPVIFGTCQRSDTSIEMLQLLLDYGADIHAKSPAWSFLQHVRYNVDIQYNPSPPSISEIYTIEDVESAAGAVGETTYHGYRIKQKYSNITDTKEEAQQKLNQQYAKNLQSSAEIQKKVDFVKCVASNSGAYFLQMYLAVRGWIPNLPYFFHKHKKALEINKKISLLLDPCSYLYNHDNEKKKVNQETAWKLYEAAFSGDVETINNLTANNALYVCLREEETGNTPLHVATINNHYHAIVRLLEIAIEQYVPVPYVVEEKKTAPQINNYQLASVMHSKYGVPKKKFRVDPNNLDLNVYTHSPSVFIFTENRKRYNLIHIAAYLGYADTIHALLEIFYDIEHIPLADTVIRPNYVYPSIPSKLISHHSSHDFYIPFELAIINGHIEAAKVLLQHAGWLPEAMSEKEVEYKLQKDNSRVYYGLNVGGKKMNWCFNFYDEKNEKERNRVLFLAAYFNQPLSLEFLLGEAYDFFVQGQVRKQLEDQHRKNKERIQKQKLSQSKAPIAFKPVNVTAESAAKIMEIFKGWSITDIDKKGNTVFHIAVGGHAIEAIEYLAKAALASNNTDLINNGSQKKGIPPLSMAIHKGDKESIVALSNCGADLGRADTSLGWTPLHVAVSTKNAEIVDLLLQEIKKAKRNDLIDVKSKVHLQTPLMIAVAIQTLPITKVLLESGASVVEKDMDGNTPLHIISKKSVSETLDTLLEVTPLSIVSTENSLGLTPLDYVHIALVKLSLNKTAFSTVFGEKLEQITKEESLKRIPADPFCVRATIDMAISHSNAAVEKARLKAAKAKESYNKYRGYRKESDNSDDEEEEEEEEEGMSYKFGVPDYNKYLEDHAPATIQIKYPQYKDADPIF